MTVEQRIKNILDNHPIVLFMKGTPEMPQCGFSARACAVLTKLNVPYFSVNVLEDQEIREGIKVYGNWPTIPQLYVRGQLIGGSDIMLEMYQSGELQALLKKELPSNS
ncbi:MAG: Grx4 family monothiol glutaredoxin [Bdellovibrionaceae bacterium]|nr:Grx4 family monothiol glutaredoxin [Pseudobdellovibrionaceae bacterium]MDW8190029.1 Grx4 family monothiol glutaredoxin [Pseudobdellovibrionaceae bacterium]